MLCRIYCSVLVVGVRFAFKGPEADRIQPTLSVLHEDNRVQTQIVNYDQTANAIIQALLDRQPLPPPSGIIIGAASDPKAIQQIDEQTALALQKEDSRLLLQSSATDIQKQPGKNIELDETDSNPSPST